MEAGKLEGVMTAGWLQNHLSAPMLIGIWCSLGFMVAISWLICGKRDVACEGPLCPLFKLLMFLVHVITGPIGFFTTGCVCCHWFWHHAKR